MISPSRVKKRGECGREERERKRERFSLLSYFLNILFIYLFIINLISLYSGDDNAL